MARTARYKKKHDDADEKHRKVRPPADNTGKMNWKKKKVNLNVDKGDVMEKFHVEWERRDDRRERRRVARIEDRQNTKVCFKCRKAGHIVSECTEVVEDVDQGMGICFICGSTEHAVHKCPSKHKERVVKYPFAKCFVCHQTGHLSKECPDNPRGLYPQGGSCKLCGSVEHFKRDCPDKVKRSGPQVLLAGEMSYGMSGDAEAEVQYEKGDGEEEEVVSSKKRKTAAVVNF